MCKRFQSGIFCNLSIFILFRKFYNRIVKVYKKTSPSKDLTSIHKRREFDVSRVLSSVTEVVSIQVGGGRVSLSSYELL